MFKVLIVDDNVNDREGLKKIINWQALCVDEIFLAENGEQGYRTAMEVRPDLVIADIAMPRLNGLEMASKLQKDIPDVKFIFISCFDESMYLKSAIEFNSYGYIFKPIDVDEIEDTIRKVLQIRSVEVERDATMTHMQSRIRIYSKGYRKQYLRDLISGNIVFDTNEILDLKEIGLEIINSYALIYFEITDVKENASRCDYEDIYNIAELLENNLRERNCVLVQSFKSCVAVIFLDDVQPDEPMSEVIKELEQCQEQIEKKIAVCVSCVMSGLSKDYSEIHELYEKIENVNLNNISMQNNHLLLTDEIDISENIFDLKIGYLKAELQRIVGLSSEEEIEEFVERIFAQFDIENLSNKRQFVYLFRALLQIIVSEYGEQSEDILMLSEKYSSINSDDLKKWCTAALRECKMRISEDTNAKLDTRVKKMKEFIDKNYSHIDKLQMVADAVYLSINHASYIFKKQTGYTMYDYLVKVRLESAKHLLDETFDKIYEISDKVGYKSPTYFTSLFKQYMNMSPKEYRARNSQ